MEIVERDVVEEEGLFGVIDEVICGFEGMESLEVLFVIESDEILDDIGDSGSVVKQILEERLIGEGLFEVIRGRRSRDM